VAAPQFEATLVWMHERPLQPGASVLLQQGAGRVPARIRELVHRIDPETYEARPAPQLDLNEIGLVRVETTRALVFDAYRENRQTGAFVLVDRIDNFTLGAGMTAQVMPVEPPLRRRAADGAGGEFDSAPVTLAERLQRYGHRPAVVVSRSEALRKALERALFNRGAAVVVLEEFPGKTQLRELLANGLILVAPTSTFADLEGADCIEAVEVVSIEESVRLALSQLERQGLLVYRNFAGRGGYLNVDSIHTFQC
jgi:hypothetical protein